MAGEGTQSIQETLDAKFTAPDSHHKMRSDQLGQSNAPLANSPQSFTLFPNLPPELRAPIWRRALTRQIVKWTRTATINTFTAPLRSIALFYVCKESRATALLYGEYVNISTTSSPVFFSPIVDYLLFEPIWIDLIPKAGATVMLDPLDTLPESLKCVRNIMVHPQYTDERKRPSAKFEKLVKLEQILVAADEKSIGFQSKFILGTVYDIKLYYAADVRKRIPDFKIPFIAVGCLGWTGKERRKMYHGVQDMRELLRVCENEAMMREHLREVREEEWRFMEEMQRGRRSLGLKLNFKSVDAGGKGKATDAGGGLRKGKGIGPIVEKGKERVEEENDGQQINAEDMDTGINSPVGTTEPPGYSHTLATTPEMPPPYAEN